MQLSFFSYEFKFKCFQNSSKSQNIANYFVGKNAYNFKLKHNTNRLTEGLERFKNVS